MGKKVLLSFVGMRDPYADWWLIRLWKRLRGKALATEGSVLTVCREMHPDIVCLFPSSKKKATSRKNQTEDRGKRLVKILGSWKDGPKEYHMLPLEVDNITDQVKLYPCFRDNVLKVLKLLTKENSLEGYEFTFNLSSGSKQMNEIAQLYLTNSPITCQYCQCAAPKYIKEGDKRVRPVSPAPLEETTLLRQIDSNSDKYYLKSPRSFFDIKHCDCCDKLQKIR